MNIFSVVKVINVNEVYLFLVQSIIGIARFLFVLL